jgi:hypothetical protein
MQEHQAAEAVAAGAPAWHLARGEEQYGPLTDRELLLLAERGGLKADDLLWRQGFDDWKPVSAVCGATAQAAIPASRDTTVQDAAGKAGVSETVGSEPQEGKPGLKARLLDELRKFLVMFAYLWLVFFVFLAHEWTVLASHDIGFRFYGLAVVNALVLSKIMLIAEGLRFAEGLNAKPLIYPIVFKSVAFSVLLMLCYIAEEIAVGFFHGKSLAEGFPKIGGGGWIGVVTIGAIMCVALVPFFAFKEIARAIGKAEFRALMFGPARKAEREGLHSAAVLTPAE